MHQTMTGTSPDRVRIGDLHPDGGIARDNGLNETKSHERVMTGLVWRLERRAIRGMVDRVPDWIKPDHLTLFGLAGALVAAVSLVLANWSSAFLLLAAGAMAANWFGDSLDGSLARHRKIERPRYGFFLDHTVDLAAQSLIFVGLAFSPLMRMDVALAGLAAYLIVTAYTMINLHVTQRFKLAYFGVGPTELRLVLMAGLGLAWLVAPATLTVAIPSLGVSLGLFDAVTGALVCGSAITLIATAVEDGKTLAREDQPQS